MADLYQEITEFSGGVQSSAAGDRIPLNATPLAINSAFKNIGSGQANLGTRPGLTTVNATALSGTPAFLYKTLYSHDTGSGFVNYLAMVASDGTLVYKIANDTFTAALAPPANFPAPSGLCFTAGDVLVDGTVMANRLFLVNKSGERRSLLGQTYQPWGLTAIASATTAAAATGVNAMPNETYDTALTVYDNDTGGESAIGTTMTTAIGGVNRRLQVDIVPTAAESAQYPFWRVYLRRQTTQASLYQVQQFYNAAGAVIVTNGNIPIGTTQVYVDMSAAAIALLTTIAPAQAEHRVPPTGIKYVATYGRRLLAASDRNLYWSQIDKPDSFAATAFEPIDTGEGDKITGIYPFSSELLVVTTQSNTWGVFGNDPQDWVIRPIDRTIGCCSHLSFVEAAGKLAWWSLESGPVLFDGTSLTTPGLDDLGTAAVGVDLEASRADHIYGGHDPQGQRIVWSIASAGSLTRNDRLLPYNMRVKRFEASYWDPLDIATLATGYIADGTQRLFAGNYKGQLFYFDKDIRNDGLPGGTATGTFVPATSSITSITASGFHTAGSGLLERNVVVTDQNDVFIAKTIIASNTATVLTLTDTISGLSAGATYNYYVAGPDFRLYTKWMDLEQTFIRKRFDRLYLQAQSEGNASGVYAATQVQFSTTNSVPQAPFNIVGAEWDTAIWDTALWAGVGQPKKRLFIGRTGQTIRISVFHYQPNQDLTLHTIGVLARAQSDRYYE